MLRLSWLSPLRNRLASVRKLPAAPFSKPSRRRGAGERNCLAVEIFEARVMLSGTDDVDATVSQSNAVVDQYSATAEQQYLAPMQDDLQAALDDFIADTAASTSSIGMEQSTSESSLGVFAGVLESASTTVTTDSQQLLDNAQTSDSQASGSVSSAVGTGTSNSGSTSLFDQNANLQSFAANLAPSAFGAFGTIGGTGTTSSSGGDYGSTSGSGGSTAGSGTTSGGTTSGSSTSGSSTSGSDDSGSDSGSDDSTDDSDSSSTDDESSSGGGWQPFVLPDGVDFEDVHLPAEQFATNLRQLQPSGQETFSNTTVTESSADGTTITLTVTLSQTYLDAEHWIVSQSWTKEYTIRESSGERTGLWSESTRHGLTSFSITVSLGFGVPDRPDVGKKKPTSSGNTEAGSTEGAEFGTTGAVQPPGNNTSPTTPPIVPVGPVSTVTFSTSDSLNKSVGDSHDGSDATTGEVDKGQFSGSSNASAAKLLALTEFDVLRPDGSLGHTIQLSSASGRAEVQRGQRPIQGRR